jgi:hypothetical protein
MNAFTVTRSDQIKREISRLGHDAYETQENRLIALTDITEHLSELIVRNGGTWPPPEATQP